MHKFSLIEPERWMKLLQRWIYVQDKYSWVNWFAPIWADIFVIIYPIFLVTLYLYAIIKKTVKEKQWALYIFFSTFFAVLLNIWVQCFFIKERPIVALNTLDMEETLLHEILPVSSFPSDHSVVWMCFAVATLLWGRYSKKSWMKYSWCALILVSFIMSWCRMLTLVHWPTDILAWYFIGIIVPCILMIPCIRNILLSFIINPIIKFEKFIVKKCFNYKQ